MNTQRGADRYRKTQRGAERYRKTQRGADRYRKTQRGADRYRKTQRGADRYRKTQRGADRYRKTQRGADRYRNTEREREERKYLSEESMSPVSHTNRETGTSGHGQRQWHRRRQAHGQTESGTQTDRANYRTSFNNHPDRKPNTRQTSDTRLSTSTLQIKVTFDYTLFTLERGRGRKGGRQRQTDRQTVSC